MGGTGTMIDDDARGSNDDDSLEHWAKANRKKCNEDKCKLFKNVPGICFHWAW